MAKKKKAPPSSPVPTWRGEPVLPSTIIDAWQRGTERMANRTDRILTAQGLRRGTLTVSLSREFREAHPDVAQAALSIMPQREGLERDLIAKAGASEPQGKRAPLGPTETDARLAEEFESYMNELAASEHGVPYQTLIEKGVEDGEYGVVIFPAEKDAEGEPDFYDRIPGGAVQKLKPEDRKAFKPDPNRPGYHARMRSDGTKATNPEYDRDAKGQKPKRPEDRDDAKSKAAHADARREYLLEHAPATVRVVPALDCVPILTRGRGKRRWEAAALIERTRVEREELERTYGWAMLGGKLLLPRGSDESLASPSGGSGEFYLYSLYYTARTDDGCTKTICVYTVGGASTWYAGDLQDGELPPEEQVACIDLYEEMGLEGRFFDYFHSLHTSDEDPDWYGRPYLWSLRNRILNIEGLETAANAAVALSAYTGHYQVLEGSAVDALNRVDPEAVIDSGTHALRRPHIPGPGDIETAVGQIVPHRQSQIGPDAWRLQQNYQDSLREATMIDQLPTQGPSGHAMLVSETLGQVAKRGVRDAALAAWEFAVDRVGRVCQAAYEEYGVRWPINTTRDQPVGLDVINRQEVAEWDPKWIGQHNYRILAHFPQEFNLARADLEMNAYLRGVRGLKHVAEAFGESDVMSLRVELAKDALWKEPESQQLLRSTVDQLRGMKRQRQAAGLQNDGRLTKNGVPGAEAGVPKVMGRAQGEPAPGGPGAMPAPGGGAGPNIAASIRGGIQGGQMGGAEQQLAAMAAMGAG